MKHIDAVKDQLRRAGWKYNRKMRCWEYTATDGEKSRTIRVASLREALRVDTQVRKAAQERRAVDVSITKI